MNGSTSGLYEYKPPAPVPIPSPLGVREELRLDVDGWYPQMTASGDIYGRLSQVHWIADLSPGPAGTYTGTIWYRDGDPVVFPYTHVAIKTVPVPIPSLQKVIATFTSDGAVPKVRIYRFKSPAFHPLDLEFDSAEGENVATKYDTGSHPVRPSNLPVETLTIQKVYERSGFAVTTSAAGSVPLAGAGIDARWSNFEMHDAMQVYWSRFAPSAQWAMWVFFASLHEWGSGLGGIMFDDMGPQHRQGTAIFNDSFIANPPAGDPNPAAFVERMRFWTACHEMGHAVNLAHSWQKEMGTPWIPTLQNEPEARSFMNYPYYVLGGTTSFFSTFEQRFSDPELLFLRHSPTRLVQPGAALWFDHHGFQGANVLPASTFDLVLRVNRETAEFEFLEVVTAELKLTNASTEPQVVDANVLAIDGDITVIIKKGREDARQLLPYARYCRAPQSAVLMPGESLYAPVMLSAGRNGWDCATPGIYTVQAALRMPTGEEVISNPLRLRVAPPLGYDEEYVADELFSDDVGRTLTFGGTMELQSAVDVLREVAGRLPDRRVAVQANLALGAPLLVDAKRLVLEPDGTARPAAISITPARPDEGKKLVDDALTARPDQAVETLGHIRYRNVVDRVSQRLADQGDVEAAIRQQQVLFETLSGREVRGRRILPSVLEEVKRNCDRLAGG